MYLVMYCVLCVFYPVPCCFLYLVYKSTHRFVSIPFLVSISIPCISTELYILKYIFTKVLVWFNNTYHSFYSITAEIVVVYIATTAPTTRCRCLLPPNQFEYVTHAMIDCLQGIRQVDASFDASINPMPTHT